MSADVEASSAAHPLAGHQLTGADMIVQVLAKRLDAPRRDEGTVEQDMNSHKKYLVETLHANLKS